MSHTGGYASFFIAQDGAASGTQAGAQGGASGGAVGVPGDTPAAPVTGAPGTPAAGGAAPRPFDSTFLLVMLGLIIFMFVVSALGPRKEKKKREQMLSAIKRHDRVQTIGGVIGSIVEIKNDVVVLKVDESSNTRLTVVKSAIHQVVQPSPGSPVEEAKTGA